MAGQADDRQRPGCDLVDAASGEQRRRPFARVRDVHRERARRRPSGADIYGGVSIDQIVARKYGQDTLLPSIQLAIEDPGANTGICGWGYSCAYSNSVSWAAPDKPLPHEINPQVVFERLYGDGSTRGRAGRARRRRATAFSTR